MPETAHLRSVDDNPVQVYFVRVQLRYLGNNRVERRGMTVYARNKADAADFAAYRWNRGRPSPVIDDISVQLMTREEA